MSRRVDSLVLTPTEVTAPGRRQNLPLNGIAQLLYESISPYSWLRREVSDKQTLRLIWLCRDGRVQPDGPSGSEDAARRQLRGLLPGLHHERRQHRVPGRAHGHRVLQVQEGRAHHAGGAAVHPAAMSSINAEGSVQLAHAFAGCPTSNDRPARQLLVDEAHLQSMAKMQVLTDGMD